MIEQQRQILELQRRQSAQAADDPPGTWLQFQPANVLQPFAVGAGGIVYYAGLPRTTQTARRFRCWVYVITRNDASNYWMITAQAADTSLIASLTTLTVPLATWTLIETTSILINPLAADDYQIVQIEVGGAAGVPGDLLLVPMFYVV